MLFWVSACNAGVAFWIRGRWWRWAVRLRSTSHALSHGMMLDHMYLRNAVLVQICGQCNPEPGSRRVPVPPLDITVDVDSLSLPTRCRRTPLILELPLWLTVGWSWLVNHAVWPEDLCDSCRTYTSVESLTTKTAGPLKHPSSSTVASLHDITGSFASCCKSHKLPTWLRPLHYVVLLHDFSVSFKVLRVRPDAAATSALFLPVTRMKLPATGMYPRITNLIFDEWQEVWNCCAGNKLHAIRPTVGDYNQKTCLSCRDTVLLNRLHIGHTV